MTKPEKRQYEGVKEEYDMPPFVFYEGFWEDWNNFSFKERQFIKEFLELLQEKYDDPEAQRAWEQKGKYWATRLERIDFRVFWQVVYLKRTSTSITQRAEEIHILIIEPIPG